jgi:general stress protein 26
VRVSSTSAPDVERATPDDQSVLWDKLAEERTAMLVTHDAGGIPIARPVQPVRIEAEARLWIFTARNGDIAADIQRSANVHVIFVSQERELYVSLNGEARLLVDPATAREIWSPLAGAWYPAGPDDPNLALLRVDVHRGDYWDMKDAKLVRFFKLTAAAVTGTRAGDIATHRRVEQ